MCDISINYTYNCIDNGNGWIFEPVIQIPVATPPAFDDVSEQHEV